MELQEHLVRDRNYRIRVFPVRGVQWMEVEEPLDGYLWFASLLDRGDHWCLMSFTDDNGEHILARILENLEDAYMQRMILWLGVSWEAVWTSPETFVSLQSGMMARMKPERREELMSLDLHQVAELRGSEDARASVDIDHDTSTAWLN